MKKYAIYARCAIADLSKIERQIAECEEFIASEDGCVAGYYIDNGYPGIPSERPGYQKMLRDADTGKFEILIVSDIDRLARDMSELARLFSRLQSNNVAIFNLSNGCVCKLPVRLKRNYSPLSTAMVQL